MQLGLNHWWKVSETTHHKNDKAGVSFSRLLIVEWCCAHRSKNIQTHFLLRSARLQAIIDSMRRRSVLDFGCPAALWFASDTPLIKTPSLLQGRLTPCAPSRVGYIYAAGPL